MSTSTDDLWNKITAGSSAFDDTTDTGVDVDIDVQSNGALDPDREVTRDPGKCLIGASTQAQLMLYPIKYRWAYEMYRDAEQNFWTFSEINTSYDLMHIRELSESDLQLLTRVLSYFAVQESLIQDEIMLALYRHITNPEIRLFLLAQGNIEAVHAVSYMGLIELLGSNIEQAYYAFQDDPIIKEKTVWAVKHLRNLEDPNFRINNMEDILLLVYNIVALSFIEGIHFFGAFAILLNFRRRSILSGISEAIAFIRRDEDQHCQFAVRLVLELLNEHKPTDTQLKTLRAKIVECCEEATLLEIKFLRECLSNGTLGLSIDTAVSYIKYLANKRLSSYGIGPIFLPRKNPLNWLSESVELPTEHNFFERSSTTNYRKGGLS